MALKKRIKEKIREIRTIPVSVERKNEIKTEMQGMLEKAKTEKRALNEEEVKKFNELKEEIRLIDETLKAEEEIRKMNLEKGKDEKEKEEGEEGKVTEEEKRFLEYIRTGNINVIPEEKRAIGVTGNTVAIPNSISKKIIEKIEEESVLFQRVTKFFTGGDLTFLINNNTLGKNAAYVDDMQEVTEATGNFTSIKLQNNIIGTLSKISRSLINRTDFDLLNYVIKETSKAIMDFLEKELVSGTTKIRGVVNSTNQLQIKSQTEITADELIDLQLTLPTTVKNAEWLMNRKTLGLVRKLKGSDGQYLCGKMADGFGFELLGKPILISDNMPDLAADAIAIAYGDFSGIYMKFAQNIEIQVLMEKYATEHAIGVLGFVEADAKIAEESKIAVIKGATA